MTERSQDRRRRRLADVTIAVALIASVLVPSSYYVRAASDPAEAWDERFAWRMFSARRATRCEVAVVEDHRTKTPGRTVRRRLKVSRAVHQGWQRALERRRPSVVDAFLDWRCEQPQVAAVHLLTRCKTAEGAREEAPPQVRRCSP